jgi:hypothetical protein
MMANQSPQARHMIFSIRGRSRNSYSRKCREVVEHGCGRRRQSDDRPQRKDMHNGIRRVRGIILGHERLHYLPMLSQFYLPCLESRSREPLTFPSHSLIIYVTRELNLLGRSEAAWPSVVRYRCQLRVECEDATNTTKLRTQ